MEKSFSLRFGEEGATYSCSQSDEKWFDIPLAQTLLYVKVLRPAGNSKTLHSAVPGSREVSPFIYRE
uniref:Uncharacterized protein n=1 Tax=Lepeophtheirus salmonis TaxID=72036 RepID=A0A0K2TCN7_LEPSM